MYNHEPAGYDCPMCKLVRGEEDEINKRAFVVYEDNDTLAYISPKWWVNNPGNVLVVPKIHVENLYDIDDVILGKVYQTAKKIALAMRSTYNCTGISTRQHNEPSGNQDVWHFHVHVFPRYQDDRLYQNHDNKHWVSHDERAIYAQKLQEYFVKIS